MTDRIFEDVDYFEVSSKGYGFDLSIVNKDNDVRIAVAEDRENVFYMTAEEATRLKEFLIKRGY
jgi:hypothetical protein